MNPKISIIVPCYNVERFLSRCMDTLLSQSLKEIEIILVDDGSPDDVPRLCDEWAARDERIRVIHKQNAGLGFARNSGLDIATGEYVAFVDSDDYVDVNMYQVLYDEALNNQADAVFCGFKWEIQKNYWKDSHEVSTKEIWTGKDTNDFMLDMIACAPYVKQERRYQMSVWHAIYRRNIIENYKLRFESERVVASEDLPFQVDFLLRANNVVYLPQSFYYYCLNDSSLSATYMPEKYERFKFLHSLLLSKMNNDSDAILRIDRMLIGFSRGHLLRLFKNSRNDKQLILNRIIHDKIWREIENRYKLSFLPFYSRLFYWLQINKMTQLLILYIRLLLWLKCILVSYK